MILHYKNHVFIPKSLEILKSYTLMFKIKEIPLKCFVNPLKIHLLFWNTWQCNILSYFSQILTLYCKNDYFILILIWLQALSCIAGWTRELSAKTLRFSRIAQFLGSCVWSGKIPLCLCLVIELEKTTSTPPRPHRIKQWNCNVWGLWVQSPLEGIIYFPFVNGNPTLRNLYLTIRNGTYVLLRTVNFILRRTFLEFEGEERSVLT